MYRMISALWCLTSVTGTIQWGTESEQQQHQQVGGVETETIARDHRDMLSVLDGSVFGAYKGKHLRSCTYDPSKIESNVVAEFLGSPELLTTEELKLLGEAFVSAYNGLASSLCDNEFRKLTEVTLASDELMSTPERHLQTGSPNRPPARRFSLKVLCLGTCRRCEKDSMLYDDAFRRLNEDVRERARDSLGVDYGGRVIDKRPIDLPGDGSKLLWDGNLYNCDCEKKGDLPTRPPGLDEFNAAFAIEVGQLFTSGQISSVQKSFGVVQVREVECEGLRDTFTSEVLVEATGDPDRITTRELNVIKDLFLQSYKQTSENLCDSKFRVVTDADVTVEKIERRLESLKSSSRVTEPTLPPAVNSGSRFRPFRFRFKVSGKCKGCRRDERLFDDGFRRYLEEDYAMLIQTKQRNLGYILNNETCYCAVNAQVRTPSTGEFEVSLSQNVETEGAASTLPNLVTIGIVLQVDDTMPSASPSMAPSTKFPSASPTPRPTPKPTRSPSLSPSVARSSVPSPEPPSEVPSVSPTRPTIPTESPVPSPQPSMSPSER